MPASESNRSTVLVTIGAGLAGSYATKYGVMEKRGAVGVDILFLLYLIFLSLG